MAAFERDMALQNDLGVRSWMIDAGEVKRLSSLIETDGLLAAAFSPDDAGVLGRAGAAASGWLGRRDR